MEETKKTGYEWCLEANLRILKLLDWDTNMGDCEESYFTEKIDSKEFYRRLELCSVKPNSQPRKTDNYLIYRMYGMVPYQFSKTAHVGIQHCHAVVRYGRTVRDLGQAETIYNKWADFDETIIVLNGGTTNTNPERLGTLNKHLIALKDAGVLVQDFYEPDLGDQLTSIAFMADERVFDRKTYPDFIPETLPWGKRKPSDKQVAELEERNKINYTHWVEKIGGAKNAFLREYLKPIQLA